MSLNNDLAKLFDEKLKPIEKSLVNLEKRMATKVDLANLEKRMATKVDLAKLEKRMATKIDLANLEAKMVTKVDLAKLEKRMATKKDLAKLETKITEYFDFLDSDVMENRKRVKVIESRLGIAVADKGDQNYQAGGFIKRRGEAGRM